MTLSVSYLAGSARADLPPTYESGLMSRADIARRIAELAGPELVIEDAQGGWPALAVLHGPDGDVSVALYVSQVGRSHRDRDTVERRFQNPAGDTPLVLAPGRVPVLIGLWDDDPIIPLSGPVVVTADPFRRADGRTTRWSVFAPLATLMSAATTGWDTHVSDSGELIRCLHPALLPAAIAADAAGAEPDADQVRTAADASGLLDDPKTPPDAPAAERARRTASSLVRDAAFSRDVLDAYDRRCAMCGLGLRLVQGAHIYPASAPGSPDKTFNGLALCANHHVAFDRHLVAVRPTTLEVTFHPDVLAVVGTDPAAKTLVDGTEPVLRAAKSGHAPDPAMFAKRYAHYPDAYGWL